MNPITLAELRRFAPNGRDDYLEALVHGWPELERAGINTPPRIVEFLGQCAHETGGFTIVRENTRWTAAQMVKIWPNRFKTSLDPRIIACRGDGRKLANLAYSNRSDIGNCGGDDGWLYRGGSFLQDTGRSRYAELERALGIPLVSNPELIENPAIGLKCAIWTWTKSGCNALADRGYTVAIGNAINRGNAHSSKLPIGHEDRLAQRNRANAIFGEAASPAAAGLTLCARGSEVEVLQRRLRDLGYGLGAIDGAYGKATARAVAAFKADQKREGRETETDDLVGPKTWAALNVAEPVTHQDREEMSAKEATKTLVAAGSEEVVAGARQKAAGNALVVISAAEGARQSGALDVAKETLGVVPQWQSILSPVVDALHWGLKNAFWAGTLLFGIWVWSGGHKTIAARIRAHVKGFNMFR